MKVKIITFFLILLTGSMLYAQVPTTNLNAMYEFTGGSFTDNANGNNFTQNGTALTTVNDRFVSANNAINLGGDYLTRADFDANTASYSFWIKTNTNDTNSRTIFDKSNRSSEAFVDGNKGFFIDMIEGKVGVNVAIVKTHTSIYDEYVRITRRATTAINDGNWHHVVVTVDKEVSTYSQSAVTLKYYFKIYIDGYLDLNTSNQTIVVNNRGDANNAGTATLAQNRPANLTTDYQFQDTIDDFFIYSKILTTAEVTQLATVNSFCFPPLPNTITASAITQNSFDVEWTEDGTFDLAYVPNGEPFSNAIIQNNITYTTGTKISLTGLQSSTLYKVYLRKPCTATLTSNWSIAKEVRTKGRIYVNANATGNNNGSSFANGFTNLQDAFTIAEDDQEIWVAKGTYKPDTADRTKFFTLKTGVKLYGGFAGNETSINDRDISQIHTGNKTILSGDLQNNDNTDITYSNSSRNDNSYRIIYIEGDGTHLDGITISSGHANHNSNNNFVIASGIFKEDSVTDISLENCIVEKNVSNRGGTLQFTFSESNSTNSVTIKNCVFRNNFGRYGGGFLAQTTTNTTTLNLLVANTLFYKNTAGDVNTRDGFSGSSFCVFSNQGTINTKIINCTFTENYDTGTNTSNDKGTISFRRLVNDGSHTINAEVYNSIFYNNYTKVTKIVNNQAIGLMNRTANKLNSLEIYNTSTFQTNWTDKATNPVTNQVVTTSPQFNDIVSDNYQLSSGSQLIDQGLNSAVTNNNITTDLAGNQRIINTTVDMGAYEYDPNSQIKRTLTINATNGSVTTNPNPTNGTYDDGTSVELTATPDAGYQFDGWSGDASGTTNPLTITMDADKTVTANFSQIMYTVTLNTVTNGSISASQTSGIAGTQITITATPDSGYEFDSWTGDIAGQTGNPITITLNSNITVGATFDATASVNDETFSKTVAVYPNPVKNTLNVKTNAVSIKEITLFNVLGRKVLQSNEKSIDVSGLSKGIYIVKLKSIDGKIATKKIMKQ